ncbi:MAG: methyltransferase domain-containing protein [Candidatus Sumerlaeaceae bacterium]|nr:methyltransferase domain-containing protein [Candidatus Sumerlaeaceae bacterium]
MKPRFFKRLSGSPQAVTYGSWWDNASRTLEDAYAATIDRTSEEEYRSRGWHGDWNSPGAKQFLERFGLGPSSRVLEIGCGIARIGRELAPRVGEWHGVDVSANMLSHARARCAGLSNVRLHHITGPPPFTVFPDKSFDFVYATIVFMHLDKEDMFACLREAHRLLKPDGAAYFDTWNVLHPDVQYIWRGAMKIGDGKPRGRIQCSAPAEFRLYLEEVGFAVETLDDSERLVRAWCRRLPGPMPIADDGLPPFGYLCRPGNEETVSGLVTLEGWALDRVARVEVLVDDEPLPQVERGPFRPEVAPAFPRFRPEAESCGFRARLDTSTLSPGSHEIRVMATDDAGRTTCLTGYHHGIIVAGGGGRSQ